MRISVRNIFASYKRHDDNYQKIKKTEQMNGEIPLEQLFIYPSPVNNSTIFCSFNVHQKAYFFPHVSFPVKFPTLWRTHTAKAVAGLIP